MTLTEGLEFPLFERPGASPALAAPSKLPLRHKRLPHFVVSGTYDVRDNLARGVGVYIARCKHP